MPSRGGAPFVGDPVPPRPAPCYRPGAAAVDRRDRFGQAGMSTMESGKCKVMRSALTRELGIGAGLALMALSLWATVTKAVADPASPPRPSIVFILSDDEDVTSHRVMAQTTALIEDQGHGSTTTSSATRSAARRGPRSCAASTRTTIGSKATSGRPAATRSSARWGSATRRSRRGCSRRRVPHGLLRQADERLRAGRNTRRCPAGTSGTAWAANSRTSTTRSTRTASWSPMAIGPRII